METKQKERVHMNDIQESEVMEPRKVFVIGDKKYYADRISKEQLSTHRNCESCSIEFEKRYTFDKYCTKCTIEIEQEKFLALPCVEWDGTTPLCIWDDDRYFFDIDDIETYCEDNDILPSQLRLVLCKQTSFSTINIYEQLADDVHEDWEPSKELQEIEEKLNTYLRNADTNTWVPINTRVIISL